MHFYTRVAVCALLSCAAAAAQESVNYSSISGRVIDPTQAPVQGAQITVRQTATNQTLTASTDREGRFRLPYLQVGRYELKVHQDGFADQVKNLTLTVGSAYELPITLAVSAAQQSNITVTGDSVVLEAARSQIAGTISQAELRDLPLNGRNYLDVALFVPGVSPTNTAANQLFAETSAVPGQGISIGSQRNFSNSFIVDGITNDEAFMGLSVTNAAAHRYVRSLVATPSNISFSLRPTVTIRGNPLTTR